jgi:hypothetical protein
LQLTLFVILVLPLSFALINILNGGIPSRMSSSYADSVPVYMSRLNKNRED